MEFVIDMQGGCTIISTDASVFLEAWALGSFPVSSAYCMVERLTSPEALFRGKQGH